MKSKLSFSLSLLYALMLLIGSPLRVSGGEPGLLIVGYGDSLMAGYGLPPGQSFPERLGDWLAERLASPVEVVNAGVSGDTTSGGRARLDWVLAPLGRAPDLVILELGSNDALRGIDPAITRENLDAMIAELRARGSRVLLAGMLAPPNMGPDYRARFDAIYPELAQKHDVALYPFFLEGVAADPALNLEDGIHPNEKGIAEMVARIGPRVLAMLE
ncbi:MAG: arylesterase [Rhodothalassiaceae bacterium]